MPIAGILFGAFCIGCLASAVLLWRLEKAFVARYPDQWRELSGGGFGRQYGHLGRLVRDRHSIIEDPAVELWTRRLRYSQYVLFAIWALFALSLITRIGLLKI